MADEVEFKFQSPLALDSSMLCLQIIMHTSSVLYKYGKTRYEINENLDVNECDDTRVRSNPRNGQEGIFNEGSVVDYEKPADQERRDAFETSSVIAKMFDRDYTSNTSYVGKGEGPRVRIRESVDILTVYVDDLAFAKRTTRFASMDEPPA
ncbi:1136_t:CDS:2 [Acaulospora colombiana]|uniref:1136_t:CDS:1 n=1 Tax=Acaulospora colombiana TaxID=27376 RepID=A0ACA9LUZ4_9GLOM|nr:1136_t:CDS:2 [Acaulospora colombiana]